MSEAPDRSQFAEVLVERDDDLAVRQGMREDGSVAGIRGLISDTFDVMSGSCDRTRYRAGDAAVDEDLHALGL